jgi:hypothetical protein
VVYKWAIGFGEKSHSAKIYPVINYLQNRSTVLLDLGVRMAVGLPVKEAAVAAIVNSCCRSSRSNSSRGSTVPLLLRRSSRIGIRRSSCVRSSSRPNTEIDPSNPNQSPPTKDHICPISLKGLWQAKAYYMHPELWAHHLD